MRKRRLVGVEDALAAVGLAMVSAGTYFLDPALTLVAAGAALILVAVRRAK